MVWFVWIFLVKYLKEVTPYFRKASLLAELGWDLQKEYMGGVSEDSLRRMANGGTNYVGPLPGPPPDSSYSRSDTRCVPLTLALLATNFRNIDPGKISPVFPDESASILLSILFDFLRT